LPVAGANNGHCMKALAFRLFALVSTVLATAVLSAQTTYDFSNGDTITTDFDTTGNNLTFIAAGFQAANSSVNISGTGSLTLTGGGNSFFNLLAPAINTYSGGTTITDGLVYTDSTSPFGSGSITLDSGHVAVYYNQDELSGNVFANNFIVSASSGSATIGSYNGSGGTFLEFTGHLTLNRPTTLFDAGSDDSGRTSFSTISGNVGTLSIQGGRVTLGGASTFTGDVVVKTNSMLQLNSPHDNPNPDPTNAYVLPLAANLTLEGTGRLRLFGSTTIGSLGSASAGSSVSVYTNGYTLRVGANDQNTTFAGSMDGFTLEKIGTGTLTLAHSDNSSLSGVIVSSGTLALGASYMFSNSMDLRLNGGTLDLGGYSQGLSKLLVSANSFIDFSGNSNLYFADSSSQSWSGTVTLLNFNPGLDVLSFGNAGGLTLAQLDLLSISGYTVTGLDGSGALLLAAVPEPSAYAAALGAVALVIAGYRRRQRQVSTSRN
jgi:hypothetical protein